MRMEGYDPEKAAKVWQRVTGERAGIFDAHSLLSMITEEWADAAAYQQLARRFHGKEAAALQALAQQAQSHAACLKGIYTLATDTYPELRTAPAPQEAPEHTLRKCYGRTLHRVSRYEELKNHPEYGRIFAQIAQQEQTHCRMLLELLGSLPQKNSNHAKPPAPSVTPSQAPPPYVITSQAPPPVS